MADSADEVAFRRFAVGDRDDFNRAGLVVRAKDELISGDFDITDRASIVFQNSVHIKFALAIRLE